MYLVFLKIIWKGEIDPWRKSPMVKTAQLCKETGWGLLKGNAGSDDSRRLWSCHTASITNNTDCHVCCGGSAVAVLAQNALLYCICPAYVLACVHTVSTWWDDVGRKATGTVRSPTLVHKGHLNIRTAITTESSAQLELCFVHLRMLLPVDTSNVQ